MRNPLVVSVYLAFAYEFLIIGSSQLNSSLLTISVIAVLLPAAFHLSVNDSDNPDAASPDSPDAAANNAKEASDILSVSRGVRLAKLLVQYLHY